MRSTTSALAAISAEIALGVEDDPDKRESEDGVAIHKTNGTIKTKRAISRRSLRQGVAIPLATDGQSTGNGSAIGTATGGVFVGEDLPQCYHDRLAEACEKNRLLLGSIVQKKSFTSTVVVEYHCENTTDCNLFGITGIELQNFARKEVMAQL